MDQTPSPEPPASEPDRRTFLGRAAGLAMAGGLVTSYGTLTAFAARFLYPGDDDSRAWVYLAQVDRVPDGSSVGWQAPDGSSVIVARRGTSGTVADFVALSRRCPHLGCQVHWEPQNTRFFCPCHNGVFDPEGKATSGPPADAGQSLPTYPLRVDNGLLSIEVSIPRSNGDGTESAVVHATGLSAPGHDRCLDARWPGRDPGGARIV